MIAPAEVDTFSAFLRNARAPRRRTMQDFAEQEIVIPTGPFMGRRFRCDRQPYSRLFFQAVDSGSYRKLLATGPSQSGKTLTCSVIPVMYHLFEQKETVGYAVPSLDMVRDKWLSDLKPAIEASRFRDLLPRDGAGSRGGTPTAIQFANGATLRFFTGGGDDQSRAGYTLRILVVTEVEGFDTTGESSRESSQLNQLEVRTQSWGRRARIYWECTVGLENTVVWATYKGLNSTESRLALPCPHCGEHVTPEREHLRGWEVAENVHHAGTLAQLFCPACGEGWSEEQRIEANQRATLLHRGQVLAKTSQGYDLIGQPPAVDTLGFRWTAANNLLVPMSDVGKQEFEAARELNSDDAELKQRQFVWCLPAAATTTQLTTLQAHLLTQRFGRTEWGKAVVPSEVVALTIGTDLGKRIGHWVLVAWFADGSGHVVDYGTFQIDYDLMGDLATLVALRGLRERCNAGFAWLGHSQPRIPEQVWTDSGYQGREEKAPVYAFVRESGELMINRYRATKGYGETDGRMEHYDQPKAKTNVIVEIGENYHFTLLKDQHVLRTDVNADFWKGRVHAGLHVPLPTEDGPRLPGTITLYHASSAGEHREFIRQILAEQKVEEYIAGRGVVIRFERVRRKNHYLDALYLAAAAADHCGVELIPSRLPDDGDDEPYERQPPLTMPDGRPFLVTERS